MKANKGNYSVVTMVMMAFAFVCMLQENSKLSTISSLFLQEHNTTKVLGKSALIAPKNSNPTAKTMLNNHSSNDNNNESTIISDTTKVLLYQKNLGHNVTTKSNNGNISKSHNKSTKTTSNTTTVLLDQKHLNILRDNFTNVANSSKHSRIRHNNKSTLKSGDTTTDKKNSKMLGDNFTNTSNSRNFNNHNKSIVLRSNSTTVNSLDPKNLTTLVKNFHNVSNSSSVVVVTTKDPTFAKTTPSNNNSNTSTYNISDNGWFAKMMQKGLHLSAKQQSRFHERKHLVAEKFPKMMRYSVDTQRYAAVVLNDNFAYRHIWKNGGTTIEFQMRRKQFWLDHPTIRNRKWMTFVRDPIDHFLSGWAEVEGRREKKRNKLPYDFRVRKYLNRTKNAAECGRRISSGKKNCKDGYVKHSFPQATFLLNNQTGTVYDQMEFIADLRELRSVLEELLEIPFKTKRKSGRVASADPFLNQYYPRRPDLLSNQTLQDICEFVAIDYFLFDFEPPEACAETLGKVAIG